MKIRVQLLRDTGAAASPDNAWQLLQGIETLSLRIERHVENAQKVAEWLEARPEVSSVSYAGLASSPWHEIGKQLSPKGAGAVLSFELAGGEDAGKKFVETLELFSHVANIGDVRSLVIHPASTTHSQLSPEEKLAAGVTPGLVRLVCRHRARRRPDRRPRARSRRQLIVDWQPAAKTHKLRECT